MTLIEIPDDGDWDLTEEGDEDPGPLIVIPTREWVADVEATGTSSWRRLFNPTGQQK